MSSSADLKQDDRANRSIVPAQGAISTTLNLEQMREMLGRDSKLGTFTQRGLAYPQYEEIDTSGLFTSLYQLYWSTFVSHRRMIGTLYTRNNNQATIGNMAQTYASAIILSLFYSISNACKVLDSYAFSQHYNVETSPPLRFGDKFASYLISSLKPKRIRIMLQDTLYIPIMGRYNKDNPANPFGINNFGIDHTLLTSLVSTFRARKELQFSEIMYTTSTGTSGWLLDWFGTTLEVNVGGIRQDKYTRANAFFHQDGNYAHKDFIIYYMIGIPLTRRLAPIEVGPLSRNNNPDIGRRRVRGHWEESVIEEVDIPLESKHLEGDSKSTGSSNPSKKRRTDTSAVSDIGSEEPNRVFAKVVYLYYANVIKDRDQHSANRYMGFITSLS